MYKISIENMKEEIKFIEDVSISGIDYESTKANTNKICSITENLALGNIEKVHFLKHNIERYQRTLEKVDRTLEGLTEIERQIIIEKYIEGKQWYIVAYNSSCSESTAKRERVKAINKLVVGIFGEEKD